MTFAVVGAGLCARDADSQRQQDANDSQENRRRPETAAFCGGRLAFQPRVERDGRRQFNCGAGDSQCRARLDRVMDDHFAIPRLTPQYPDLVAWLGPKRKRWSGSFSGRSTDREVYGFSQLQSLKFRGIPVRCAKVLAWVGPGRINCFRSVWIGPANVFRTSLKYSREAPLPSSGCCTKAWIHLKVTRTISAELE